MTEERQRETEGRQTRSRGQKGDGMGAEGSHKGDRQEPEGRRKAEGKQDGDTSDRRETERRHMARHTCIEIYGETEGR